MSADVKSIIDDANSTPPCPTFPADDAAVVVDDEALLSLLPPEDIMGVEGYTNDKRGWPANPNSKPS